VQYMNSDFMRLWRRNLNVFDLEWFSSAPADGSFAFNGLSSGVRHDGVDQRIRPVTPTWFVHHEVIGKYLICSPSSIETCSIPSCSGLCMDANKNGCMDNHHQRLALGIFEAVLGPGSSSSSKFEPTTIPLTALCYNNWIIASTWKLQYS